MKLYLFSISILKKNLILICDFFIDKIRPSLSIIIFLHSFCCLDPPIFNHYMCAFILLFRSARLYPLYVCIHFAVQIRLSLSIIYVCIIFVIQIRPSSSWSSGGPHGPRPLAVCSSSYRSSIYHHPNVSIVLDVPNK